MGEGGKMGFDNSLPPDAFLIRQIGAGEVYYSRSANCIFISITDYHTNSLTLSRKDLLELIAVMDKGDSEIQQEILTEIEDDYLTKKMENIISKDKSRERFRGAQIRLVVPKNE